MVTEMKHSNVPTTEKEDAVNIFLFYAFVQDIAMLLLQFSDDQKDDD